MNKGQSVLERLRTTRKESKISSSNQGQLQEDSFVLPSFKPVNPVDLE